MWPLALCSVTFGFPNSKKELFPRKLYEEIRYASSNIGIGPSLDDESVLYLYYFDNNAPVYFWLKSFEPKKKHEKDALIYKLVLFDLIKIIQMIRPDI